MTSEVLGGGRRGSVTRDPTTQIVTKTANRSEVASAIRKEIVILRKLNDLGIDRVPQVRDRTSTSFCYHYLDGEVVQSVWERADLAECDRVVRGLLRCAYELDRHGISHGEYDQPRTNMLWDGQRVSVIDFERGSLHNTGCRNMRQFGQWLVRQGWLTDRPPRAIDDAHALWRWIEERVCIA